MPIRNPPNTNPIIMSTGVRAGTYNNANITIGIDGRIIAASSGIGGGGVGLASRLEFTANTTTEIIHATQGNSRILEVVVGIDVPFNGTGWLLSVGDDADQSRLFGLLIDLGNINRYETNPGVLYLNPTAIYLYLNSGSATAGNGFVYILEG